MLLNELGLRSGLWQAMSEAGPLSVAEIAGRTGVQAPLVREWVRSQAAAGYLEYDPAADHYELPDAVAVAFLQAPGGATISACLEMMRSMTASFDELAQAFTTDGRYAWHQRDFRHWRGTDQLTRAQLPADVIADVVESMGSVTRSLTGGGSVLDVGCGFGFPTLSIAARYPQASVLGIDYHERSVAEAQARAQEAGLADRVSFQVAAATDLPGSGYSLVTFFDSLHDFGQPEAALDAARRVLAPGGAVLVCDNDAADSVADNLNPVGRMYYAVSTLVCTPNALSQQGSGSPEPLGTYAGAHRIAELAHRAGFREVRREVVRSLLASAATTGVRLDSWLVDHFLEETGTPAPEEIEPRHRFRLFEAVASVLEQVADTGPMIVSLDDLQWADEVSIALLAFLIRRLAAAPVLLLGAYRDAEARDDLRALASRAETLPLVGLDEPGVAELIAAIQGPRPDPYVARIVWQRSGGNPFFVRELTRLAVAQGGWSPSDAELVGIVPDSIAQALRARLAMLSGETINLLQVIAVNGRGASRDLLRRVLKQPLELIDASAAPAVAIRVLRTAADSDGWAFVHDLYPAVIEGDLSPGRRAVLNASVGEALEVIYGQGPAAEPSGRLAAHFVAGGPRVRAKAVTYLVRAAAEATNRFGHADACRYLGHAVRLLDNDPATLRDRLDLLAELGAASRRAGDITRARDCYRTVARLADAIDPLSLARAALGQVALEVRSGTPVDDNLALLRRAIAQLAGSSEPSSAGDSDATSTAMLSKLYAALARELVHAAPDALKSDDELRSEAIEAAHRARTLAVEAHDDTAGAQRCWHFTTPSGDPEPLASGCP